MTTLVVGRYFAFTDQLVEIQDKAWGEVDDDDNPLEYLVRVKGPVAGHLWMWIKASELARVLFPTNYDEEVEPCTATADQP